MEMKHKATASARGKRIATFVAGAASALVTAFSGKSAHASGYLVDRFGADHGSPAAANPYSVFFNPAAMSAAPGTQATFELATLLRMASYERSNAALGDRTLADPSNNTAEASRYRDANTGKATLTNLLVLPYIGATTDLGLKTPFRLGYAFYIPFGGLAQWDKRTDAITNDALAPGARDGQQRWHSISGQLLSIYNTLAVSYMIPSLRLSFGANASFVHHKVNTIRARNIPQNDDTITSGEQLVEGRTRFEASGNNISAALGVYWEPKEDRSIKLGLSYTSQPGFGEMRLKGELTAQAGTSPTVNAPTPVDFLQTYPDVVRFGASYAVNKQVELRTDLSYARWSTFKHQCVVAPGQTCDVAADGSGDGLKIIINVPRPLQDSVGGKLGLGYYLNDETELFGSAAFSTSAVPKSAIDAAAIDSFRLYGTVGARRDIGKHFALAGSFNAIYFLPVDTKGAAATDELQNPSKSPSSDGVYKSTVLFLNLNGTLKF